MTHTKNQPLLASLLPRDHRWQLSKCMKTACRNHTSSSLPCAPPSPAAPRTHGACASRPPTHSTRGQAAVTAQFSDDGAWGRWARRGQQDCACSRASRHPSIGAIACRGYASSSVSGNACGNAGGGGSAKTVPAVVPAVVPDLTSLSNSRKPPASPVRFASLPAVP